MVDSGYVEKYSPYTIIERIRWEIEMPQFEGFFDLKPLRDARGAA